MHSSRTTQTNRPHTMRSSIHDPRMAIDGILNPSTKEQYTPSCQVEPAGRQHYQSSPSPDGLDSYNAGRSSKGSSPDAEREKRAGRPKYEEEEMFFIWYHRVDLGLEWQTVNRLFNNHFPNRPRSGNGGIQCKFYRITKDWNVPSVRERSRMRSGRVGSGDPAFGVVQWTGRRYPWMEKHHS